MKHKQILMPTLGFLFSTALYIWLLMPGRETVFPVSDVRLFLHGIPAFFLMLFVLRATEKKLLRAIPPLLLLIPLSFAAFFWIRNNGWDRLGAAVFLVLSAAPAVGFAVAALVHRLSRRKPD